MDLKEIGGAWTEEQHSAFLNWIEESFVRRMRSRGMVGTDEVGPRLDRVLPDSETESNRRPLEKKKLSNSNNDRPDRGCKKIRIDMYKSRKREGDDILDLEIV